MMLAFILEGLGTTELLVILVVALILFGPRKLPQLSRSLGKSLGDFKRASEEFKRTWEKEVALEASDKQGGIERAMLPEDDATISRTVERKAAVEAAADEETWDTSNPAMMSASTNADDSTLAQTKEQLDTEAARSSNINIPAEPLATEAPRKRDWL